jgi:hypothetical protein
MVSPVINEKIDRLKVRQAVFMPDFDCAAYYGLKMSGNRRGKWGIG